MKEQKLNENEKSLIQKLGVTKLLTNRVGAANEVKKMVRMKYEQLQQLSVDGSNISSEFKSRMKLKPHLDSKIANYNIVKACELLLEIGSEKKSIKNENNESRSYADDLEESDYDENGDKKKKSYFPYDEDENDESYSSDKSSDKPFNLCPINYKRQQETYNRKNLHLHDVAVFGILLVLHKNIKRNEKPFYHSMEQFINETFLNRNVIESVLKKFEFDWKIIESFQKKNELHRTKYYSLNFKNIIKLIRFFHRETKELNFKRLEDIYNELEFAYKKSKATKDYKPFTKYTNTKRKSFSDRNLPASSR